MAAWAYLALGAVPVTDGWDHCQLPPASLRSRYTFGSGLVALRPPKMSRLSTPTLIMAWSRRPVGALLL